MIGIKGLLNADGWPEVVGVNVSERQNKLDSERRERQPTPELQVLSYPGHPGCHRSGPLGPHHETVSPFALNVCFGRKADMRMQELLAHLGHPDATAFQNVGGNLRCHFLVKFRVNGGNKRH